MHDYRSGMENGQSKRRVWTISGKTVLLFLLLGIVFWTLNSNAFWRMIYPIYYYREIQAAARDNDVDPLLVAAVVRVESKYQSGDVSHAGAVGLMQLMPDTANWIARKRGDKSFQVQQLSNPRVSLSMGAWYIHYLVDAFHGNTVAAVAAYNAGPNRVSQWLQSGQWDGTISHLDSISVDETRHFVERVFYIWAKYQKIYGRVT